MINKIEIFQSFCRKCVNPRVKKFFRDRGEEIEENFSEIFDKHNPEHITKRLCLHEENDTIQATLLALDFFYRFINPIPVELDDIFYGIPVDDHEEKVRYKPQVEFFFTQEYEERDDAMARGAKSPVRMQMSLRIIDPNKYQLTLAPSNNAALLDLAKEIRFNFKGYKFEKGIYKASYHDTENGLRLIIPYHKEIECREIIRRFLACFDMIPDYDRYFKPDGRERANLGEFEELTGKLKEEYIDKELMLGERKNTKRDRAIGTVFLYHTVLKVWNRDPVVLCHYRPGRGLADL